MPAKKAGLEKEVRDLKYDLMSAESELKYQSNMKKYTAAKTRNAYAQGIYIIFALLVVFNVNEDYILWAIMAAIVIGVIVFSLLERPKHPHER